jgi:hypothetical protein
VYSECTDSLVKVMFNTVRKINTHLIIMEQLFRPVYYHDSSSNTTSPDPIPSQDFIHQDVDEEPLYVNAKQYFRILKRRVARARLEELHRLSRQRKVRSFFLPFFYFIHYFHSLIFTNLVINMQCVVQEVQAVVSSPLKK